MHNQDMPDGWDALKGTGVAVRTAGDGDEVAGVRPRWVALPESAGEIAAVMRACAAHDLAAVPTGGGTKLHWGAPPTRCDVLVDLCCMNRVIEHAAGDLVVRAQAGVTVEALAGVLAADGQELALDVPVPGTTVGGLLATGIAGPRRFRRGTARDLLIGVTVVLADGTIAKSGGKVVKNVAGYDLGKLLTGSYGTLGIIADATFRLHPLPAARVWVTTTVARPVTETERAPAVAGFLPATVAPVTESPLEPSAVEIDWPDVDGPCTLAVLVEGAAAAERAKTLRELTGEAAEVTEEPPPWWNRLPDDDALLELRACPAALARVLPALREAAHASGARPAIRGSLAAGTLHIGLRGRPGQIADFVGLARDHAEGTYDGRVIVLAAPEETARSAGIWGRVGALPLMRRVKERFDPDHRLSPGRLAGGV